MQRIKYNSEIEYEIEEFVTKAYYKIGTNIRHRLDGPAIEYTDGNKQYWVNGNYIYFSGTNEELIIKNLLE